ncbi:MAG: response regulator [Anaerolineaceae bacterium]|nr:response regulator [Anaerolineaceae bacterium]
MDRILIVDDALDLGRLWQTALRTAAPELNIAVVPSAEEALLEANYHVIDLLVTDIRLPGMDGLELVERIRRLHPDIKVILVTGMRDANYEKAVKALNADAFFEKPFELEILVTKVMTLLELDTDSCCPEIDAVEVTSTESRMDTRLSDVLVSFRDEVNALAIILLDREGKIVELCGDIPAPDFESVWVPSMLKVLKAGGEVSHLLGKDVPEKDILAFSGKTFDMMLLAPVAGYSLVSILKSGRTTVRPSLVFEATTIVQPVLVKILAEMGIPAEETTPTPAAEVPLAEVEPEENLENMLSQSLQQDADAFWNAAPDVNVKSNQNTLTFEEAKRRGLTPKDTG